MAWKGFDTLLILPSALYVNVMKVEQAQVNGEKELWKES